MRGERVVAGRRGQIEVELTGEADVARGIADAVRLAFLGDLTAQGVGPAPRVPGRGTALRQSPDDNVRYGVTHSVHAAITTHLVARRLSWPLAQILSAFKAALTMNVAMIELQGRLATQISPLTPPENLRAMIAYARDHRPGDYTRK